MDHHDPEFLKRAAEARARIQETPADTVTALQRDGTIVVDVRSATEHAAGCVAGALNLPLDRLAEAVAAALPDRHAPVLTYCNGGNRGALGADALQKLGYTNVKSIAGGLRAYQALLPRTIAPAALNPEAVRLIDVRRAADHQASDEALPGATWKNPEHIDDWIGELPKDQDVVIYCVRGGGVSNSVVDRLRADGIRARFIEGGIEAYKAAGGKVVTK